MKFREATIKDLSRLNQISVASKAHWGYPKEWMEHWMDDLILTEAEVNSYGIMVLELLSEIIGFCAIVEEAGYYEVMHLWLLPNHIGKGYGKVLLDTSIAKFVSKKKPIWTLADPNAELFYTKQGFVTFDKRESFPKGRFLPLMRK